MFIFDRRSNGFNKSNPAEKNKVASGKHLIKGTHIRNTCIWRIAVTSTVDWQIPGNDKSEPQRNHLWCGHQCMWEVLAVAVGLAIVALTSIKFSKSPQTAGLGFGQFQAPNVCGTFTCRKAELAMMHQLLRQLLLCMALVWRKLKAASSGKKNMGSTKSSSQIQRAEVFFTAARHLPRPTRLQLYVSCHKQATLPEVPISPKALWILLFVLMHCNMIWVNITEHTEPSKQSLISWCLLVSSQTEVSCVRSKQLLDNGDPTILGDDFCKSAAWQTPSSIYESTRKIRNAPRNTTVSGFENP